VLTSERRRGESSLGLTGVKPQGEEESSLGLTGVNFKERKRGALLASRC